jgi:hypothetical protein
MPVSFAKDILPLFRPVDIDHMRPYGVVLDDYSYMSNADQDHKHAKDVDDYLVGRRKPRMPIGGPYWTPDQIALFEQWMKDGCLP